MFVTAVRFAPGLTPCIGTARLVHRHRGWPLALLARLRATIAFPLLVLATLTVFPPLGIGAGAVLAAFHAYDHGRIRVATMWTAAAIITFACSSWRIG
ncbi:hypothetical protein ABZ864_40460 [Streptomyces sp. NPDC047082]|uniref:hypothetical protein n=1 Tax=Streptomyces sp. NPDC047082 TaxID=3155259 RepID=UPI0033C259C9